jgi:hypothetical protein
MKPHAKNNVVTAANASVARELERAKALSFLSMHAPPRRKPGDACNYYV